MLKRTRRSVDLLAFTSLLFFASGSTGLAYEVIWSKRFTHIWGSSSLAMASVVASFMFGLGLGAYLIGRVADRVRRPLLWYGLAEIAIGAMALVIPWGILALSALVGRIDTVLPEVESIRFLVRCGLTLLVIGPPCVLMGGTLPLLIRQFTPRDGELGAVVGWLYAINTFGAATGCVVAGFYLLPAWGLAATNYGTAALNLLIGGISIPLSIQLARRLGEGPPKDAAVTAPLRREVATTETIGWRSVYLAAALSGLAALMLQMVWVRQLALVLGGSTYAFTATLFIVLIGIALGSLIYQFWLQRFADRALLSTAVVLALAFSAVVGMMLLPWLSHVANEFREQRWQWSVNARLSLTVAAVVQMLPCVAMGVLFPLLVDRTRAAAAVVGRTVGGIYAWNTLGSIAGATFTSFYFIPWFGTVGTMAGALALYLAAGWLLVMPLQRVSWRSPVWGAYGAASVMIVAGVGYYGARVANPMDTNFGLYMYDVHQYRDLLTVDFFAEGASCNVMVVGYPSPDASRPQRDLRVNGKVDASTWGDMPTQLGGAIFPKLFNVQARDILVIGYGSGTTPGACLLFPDTRVTCCEIEPAVFAASSQFASVNHSPEQHLGDRLTMVFGDGRTFVQTSDQKFDLIISEPSNPWLAGASNLFTREYFAAVSERLNEGGVLVQWLQTYNFSVAEYALIVRTLREEFPYAGVLCLSNGGDTLLLASHSPLMPTADEIDYIQTQVDESTALRDDLNMWFGTTDVRRLLVRRYLLDEHGLDRFVTHDGSPGGRAGVINTDLNMKLEFDAPLRLFSKAPPDVFPTIIDVVAPDWSSDLAQAMGRKKGTADYFMDLAEAHDRRGQVELAVDSYRHAIEADPDNDTAYRELAVYFQQHERNSDAIDVLQQLVSRGVREPALLAQLGVLFTTEQRPDLAIEQYRAALELNPQLWPVMNNLAWLLATYPDKRFRDGREALRLARQACDATKNEVPLYLDTLAAAYAEIGEFEAALATLSEAIALAEKRNDAGFVSGAKARTEYYEQQMPYRDG